MSDDILTFTTAEHRWLSRESKKLTFGVDIKTREGENNLGKTIIQVRSELNGKDQ